MAKTLTFFILTLCTPYLSLANKKNPTNSCDRAGPQSPRDIENMAGSNPIIWPQALDAKNMNLCNIHFHRNAEHKGAEFSKLAGLGDHQGYVCNAS